MIVDLEKKSIVLASRGQRLKAACIDFLVFMIPAMLLVMIFPDKKDIPTVLSMILGLYTFVIIIIQGIFLTSSGQTIGKKIIKIRIVRRKDEKNGGFVTNVLLRVVVNGLLGIIPLYHLIDTLFIFSQVNRCLHDRIAGTIVVQ